MAITEITTPDDYHPFWHPIYYEYDSDIKGNDEFKYVFVIINSGYGTPPNRTIKVSPRPGDGYGVLNIMRHIQDLWNPESFDIKEASYQSYSSATYTLRIDEEYKDGGGNIVTITGPSKTVHAFNFILNRNDWLNYSEDDYILLSSADRLLWNIEEKTKVLKNDIFFIHHVNQGTGGTYVIRVTEFFNGGGTNVITTGKVYPSRASLDTLDLAAILTDPDNTFKIEYTVRNAANTADRSETRTLLLDDQCSVYTKHKLIYLDSKGSYNSLNFDFVSRSELTVKPKTYRKYIDPSTEADTSRPITRYYTDATDQTTLNTDVLSDKHNLMLRDLVKSTDVWLDVRNDDRFPDVDFLPIELITNKFTEKKSENQELQQFTVRFRFSYDEVTR